MNKIIAELCRHLKESPDLITFEESAMRLMHETFADMVSEVFGAVNQILVAEAGAKGAKVERNDTRHVTFQFGPVAINRTLMKTENEGSSYPLDEWLGLRKHQRYSPLVEVKAAETASESTYRATAGFFREWTAVAMSHQTVGTIVRQVGQAQAEQDRAIVSDIQEAAELPEAPAVDHMMAEADGLFVRGLARKQSIEVKHAITYLGWAKNGKRVSLKMPYAVLSTKTMDEFWEEVQATTAARYDLRETQVVTNSDGGQGYTGQRFQAAFSQSNRAVWHHLDRFHIAKALQRAFRQEKGEMKTRVKQAIQKQDAEAFKLWLDSFESTLASDKQIEQVQALRTYILNHWDVLQDWRDGLKDLPEDARSLGAMESHQRHLSFRMKKRGMHWSPAGAEAMVKVKQGMLNDTIREAYIQGQIKSRTAREQREVNRTMGIVRHLLKDQARPSIGAHHGRIPLHAPHSSAMGQLVKSF